MQGTRRDGFDVGANMQEVLRRCSIDEHEYEYGIEGSKATLILNGKMGRRGGVGLIPHFMKDVSFSTEINESHRIGTIKFFIPNMPCVPTEVSDLKSSFYRAGEAPL